MHLGVGTLGVLWNLKNFGTMLEDQILEILKKVSIRTIVLSLALPKQI
jgi:hypothetical protein